MKLPPPTWTAGGREVGSRRARVLRKRGEDVRFSHWLPSGKTRYDWFPKEKTIVRKNLMTRKGYSPYCGGVCKRMPRTRFDGSQFVCPDCAWRSEFPKAFIARYLKKWGKS